MKLKHVYRKSVEINWNLCSRVLLITPSLCQGPCYSASISLHYRIITIIIQLFGHLSKSLSSSHILLQLLHSFSALLHSKTFWKNCRHVLHSFPHLTIPLISINPKLLLWVPLSGWLQWPLLYPQPATCSNIKHNWPCPFFFFDILSFSWLLWHHTLHFLYIPLATPSESPQ